MRTFLSLLACLIVGLLPAQVNYSFKAFTGSYSNLSTTNSIPTILSDDALSGLIPIGFTFNYNGTGYTKVKVSSNGWVTFDTVTTSSNLTNSLTSGLPRPIIAPLWDDLDGSSGSAYYLTTGTTPNRVFTVEMRNWEWNYSASSASISIQVKLFEGSNKIQFVYRQETGSVNSPSASIGLTALNTGAGNFISLTNSGAAPGVSTTIETNNISTRPATNQVYEFSPLTCIGPGNFAVTKVNATTSNVSFTSINVGDTFYLEYGVQGFTRGTGTVVSDTSKASGIQKTVSGLLPVYYDFYVFEKCSATDTSLITGPYTLDNTPDLNYLFRAFSGTFAQVSSGNSLSSIEGDDRISGVIPIGFPFEFHGTTYHKMKASSNGWATFDTTTTSNVLTNDLSNSQSDIRPLVAPLWDDLSGSMGTASYITTGTSPNRVFTIEYLNWQWNYSASGAVISMQIKLYETSNTIQFIYKQESGSVNSPSASIGIAARATGTGKFQSLSNSSANPSVSNQVETDTISVKPASGQVYEFRPDTTGNVGVVAILSPDSGACGTNKMPVQVAIKNFGNNVQSYIPVEVRVTGANAASLSYLYTGVLLPGATDTLQVGLLSAASGGAHNILAYTNSPGETHRANDSLRVSRTFVTGLSVDLGGDTSFCLGSAFSYTLSAAAPGAAFRWQDNSTGSSFTVTGPGVYWLELTASNGCKAADTMRVTTDSLPVIHFPAISAKCLNSPAFTLNTATPTGGIYSGTGVSSGIFSPTVAGTGTHYVQYQFTDLKGCTGRDSVAVFVDTLPQVSFANPGNVCQSSTLYLLTTGAPSGGYYSGPRVSANYYVPSRIGTDTLLYIRVGANTCRDTAMAAITVVGAPVVSIAAFPPLCENSPIHTFTEGNPAGGVYTVGGIGSSAIDPDTAGIGTYSIGYAYTDSNSCSATTWRNLTIHSKPAVSVNLNHDTCLGQQLIHLSGGSPIGGTYTGNFVQSGSFDPTQSGAGVFSVMYHYTDSNSCTDSISATLEIFPNPSAVLPDSAFGCVKESVLLDAGNAGASYLWGDGQLSQTITVSVSGLQNVAVTDVNGCVSLDTCFVSISEVCVGIKESVVQHALRVFPNPTTNFLNIEADRFEINKIEIFDALGRKFFDIYVTGIIQKKYRVDTSLLSKGSYILKVTGGSEESVTAVFLKN